MDSSLLLTGIDAVVVQLRVLASIAPGDKLRAPRGSGGGAGGGAGTGCWCEVEIDPPATARGLLRKLRGDGRAASLDAIARVVAGARRASRVVGAGDCPDARHLLGAAAAALDGLKALRQTYAADPATVARLDALCYRLADLIGYHSAQHAAQHASENPLPSPHAHPPPRLLPLRAQQPQQPQPQPQPQPESGE